MLAVAHERPRQHQRDRCSALALLEGAVAGPAGAHDVADPPAHSRGDGPVLGGARRADTSLGEQGRGERIGIATGTAIVAAATLPAGPSFFLGDVHRSICYLTASMVVNCSAMLETRQPAWRLDWRSRSSRMVLVPNRCWPAGQARAFA